MNELVSLSQNDDEIKERFYASLEFGTAGLRGKMRMGTNAMNRFTVAQATQGLANLVIKEGRSNDGVVIAYDEGREYARVSQRAEKSFLQRWFVQADVLRTSHFTLRDSLPMKRR